MRAALAEPLSDVELADALRALPRHSCPGEDGLSPAFFLRYWEVLGPDLGRGYQHILDNGTMPQRFSEGLLFLIPKGEGVTDDIRQWRPITILNTVYKVLAKALSLRIQPFLGDLIHATQTGFVKERSILDNIFIFWEATALARLLGEDLVVLLLDFEKAYDRVDWAFLEGTMLRMGFEASWIRGVSALYSTARSQVLMAGGRGPLFELTRSVRQGCPFAPFLFLFFAEALSMYLTAEEVGLRGIQLPVRGEDLVDSKFADDTGLYLHGQEANLERAEQSLQVFCEASGALINWRKTVAFWISSSPTPAWSPAPGFRWIPPGTAVRYLGCQVGLDLSPEQQIAPLLLSIRKKLLFWSSARLSLAGRVVVTNQVLLATMWYITSCWIFSSSCIGQVQRLIRNFLWSGGDGQPARAKVAWAVITLPLAKGGLGIIDPVDQSRALLGKLIVRGLLPGSEPWKELLHQRIQARAPPAGGTWAPEIRWIFTEMRRTGLSRGWEDRFALSILRAWELLRPGLSQRPPSCDEERARQPLIWSPSVRTEHGHLLGTRPRLAWGPFAAGPARSFGNWQTFRSSPEEMQLEQLSLFRGR